MGLNLNYKANYFNYFFGLSSYRSALYSLFAPTFRSWECHIIRPCTVWSLPLTEARLRDYRTSLFIRTFATRD